MSFAEVLQKLPKLTAEQRQILVRRVMELEETPLSADEDAIVGSRLASHRQNPESSVPLDQFKSRLRRRLQK
jgi:hypothetical protein